MALRFLDGFEHYTTFTHKYENVDGNTPAITGSGRFGSGMSCTSNTGGRGILKTLDAQATWIVGFAYQTNGIGTEHVISRLLDTSTLHMDLRVSSAGLLYATRNGTFVAGGAGTAILANVWYYIEWRVTINDTTGAVSCRLNDVEQFAATNVDTRNGANASANVINIGSRVSAGSTPIVLFDDFYVCDATGGVADDCLGDLRVETLLPNGNGNSSVLVGSDADSTDNYLLVDEAAPDDDTTFVESSTPGDKDTYAYPSLATASGTVHGLIVNPRARKTDAGTRSIVSVARLSGGTEEDSAAKALGSGYLYLPDVRHTKPGGGAWSISDVNGAEFGVKVNA